MKIQDISIIEESAARKAALADKILSLIGEPENENPNSGEDQKKN